MPLLCHGVLCRATRTGQRSPAGHGRQQRRAVSTQFVPAGHREEMACLRRRRSGCTRIRCLWGTARSRHPGGCNSLAASHSAAKVTCKQGESRAAGSRVVPGAGHPWLTPAYTGDTAVPGTAWKPVPAQGSTAGAAALCPKAAWVCCPRAGNTPWQPLVLRFPRSTRASNFLLALWGPLCHSLCKGLCPRVLCRWCCQAGTEMLDRLCQQDPCVSPGMGTNESGTRTAGAARDGSREVSVAGRLGVNAASFDFPGVYLPHRGGDFLPERKPCLAHALPDAIAPRYARSKVGHCSPAGYQVLFAPVKAPVGAESTAHADTPSTGWAGG